MRSALPRLAAGIAAFLVFAAFGSVHSVADTDNDWSGYLFNARHQSRTGAQTTITPANAAALSPDWTWQPDPPVDPNPAPALLTASPTVYGGVIYQGSGTGDFYAIDDSTGEVIWKRFIASIPSLTCPPPALGFTSTATVAEDPVSGDPTVYVGAADGYLYALDAASGDTVWRARVALPSNTVNDYYLWSSPSLIDGHIYIGVASNCDQPLVRGGVVEFSQSSGARMADWFSVAKGKVGGTIWTSVAGSNDSVFATTGNSNRTDSQVGYSDSIVRLSAGDLRLQGSWTIPMKAQLRDGDFGASPTTFTGMLHGKQTGMVSACNKNGMLYVLRSGRLADGPVWSFRVASSAKVGTHHCLAATVFDGSHLIASGVATSVGGTHYLGSVREFNASTGHIVWETGLPAGVIGTPSLNGGGVLAVPTMDSSAGAANAVFLVDAADGTIITQLPTGTDGEFAQPIFADGHLFLASLDQGLTSYSAP